MGFLIVLGPNSFTILRFTVVLWCTSQRQLKQLELANWQPGRFVTNAFDARLTYILGCISIAIAEQRRCNVIIEYRQLTKRTCCFCCRMHTTFAFGDEYENELMKNVIRRV